MQVIIKMTDGVIKKVITCKSESQAWLLYMAEAKNMGVDLDDFEGSNNFGDMYEGRLVAHVDETLEFTDKELYFTESTHYKRVK